VKFYRNAICRPFELIQIGKLRPLRPKGERAGTREFSGFKITGTAKLNLMLPDARRASTRFWGDAKRGTLFGLMHFALFNGR
jgi:hypothetical protein